MIEKFRKRPIVVEMMLWDGTPRRLFEIRVWIDSLKLSPDMPPFLYGEQSALRLWNEQEGCYVDCPVGHRVVRGLLDEFYPISPEAVEKTYVPACDEHRTSPGSVVEPVEVPGGQAE